MSSLSATDKSDVKKSRDEVNCSDRIYALMLNDKGNYNNHVLVHSELIQARLHMRDDDADADVVSTNCLLLLLLLSLRVLLLLFIRYCCKSCAFTSFAAFISSDESCFVANNKSYK